MTYAEILKKSDALRRKYAGTASYTFAIDVAGYINSAEVNANDTVHTDKTATEAEWDRIFWSSLEMLLADTRNTKITNWFKRAGVKF